MGFRRERGCKYGSKSVENEGWAVLRRDVWGGIGGESIEVRVFRVRKVWKVRVLGEKRLVHGLSFPKPNMANSG